MIEALLIFIVFALVMLGMAVGVMCGRKPIAGSCGGLGAVGVERACGCKDVCKNEEVTQQKSARQSSDTQIYRP